MYETVRNKPLIFDSFAILAFPDSLTGVGGSRFLDVDDDFPLPGLGVFSESPANKAMEIM